VGCPSCSPTIGPPTRWPSSLRQLIVAVGQLEERDRTVIRLYYLESHTLAEIGRMLGVTESRVCQLHSRLVGRLRGRLDELAVG